MLIKVANRAAQKAMKLYEIQQELNVPEVQKVLESFANASLRVNNAKQLTEIADQIKQFGQDFAANHDGTQFN